ncbi:putative NADH-quinone oxidoreductase subunit 5 [Simkania negevensis Z]|uniref:Putative NADH-quinone oxidoreductase subunit 5 n=1 Tax=Simkania negevensis (strain ATCC VR-1471 / DSM 27360 / Z) TaxID=331113 RepID=F8L5J1_SIMNZ|nr:putative NADH-quinone oxidoreductase subunit 5 [Simkania negevensis Z]
MTALGLLGCGFAWLVELPNQSSASFLGYRVTELSRVLATLILFTSMIIHIFSLRYMAGDRRFLTYFSHLGIVTSALLSSVIANHLLLLLFSLGVAYFTLTRLMIHKKGWSAAKEAGRLASITFGLGLALIAVAGAIFTWNTGNFEMTKMIENAQCCSLLQKSLGTLCLILAALTFSGIWPFHRFLISSANSPTPVSALMHAGLINGGGVLLVRFAPIYAESIGMMNLILILGLLTATLGTFWKLIQTDIKRMLACSTMAQMGFMFIQCGLGLFPAAIAHLCWHGVFKSYLFLRSGSIRTVQKKRTPQGLKIMRVLMIIGCGIFAAEGFMYGSFYPLSFFNSSAVLVIIACIGGVQLGNAIMNRTNIWSFFLTGILCMIMGWVYALSVGIIEKALGMEALFVSHPINFVHFVLVLVLITPWALMQFRCFSKFRKSSLWKRVYVAGLNGSQPHPKTITAHWAEYKY